MNRFMTGLLAVGAVMVFVAGPVMGDDEPVEDAAKPQAAAEADEPQADEESQTDAGDAPDEKSDSKKTKPGDSPEESDDPEPAEPGDKDEESEDSDDAEDSVSDEEFLQDPFSYLQSDMQSATVDLKDGETKPPATVTQPRILNRLGMLIEELERQSQGAGQAGLRALKPAGQSSLKRGPGGVNAMRAPRDDGRDWANLTPQERQKILQSKTDGFPAGYDEILADYFRRVARAKEPDVVEEPTESSADGRETE